MTQEDPALERAKKHVKNVRDFYYHLMTYLLVNAMLVVVDRRSGGEGDFLGLEWAYWVIIFWGFGIGGHAVSTFLGEYRVQKLYEQEKGRDLGSR